MLTYCVKQRKKTECVPGSEQIGITKRGRRMMKCKCTDCGITKKKKEHFLRKERDYY